MLLAARRSAKKPKLLKPRYRRLVLKLSGEALKAKGSQDNISPEIVAALCEQIREVHALGVQLAIVIGGGNIWRGLSASHRGMERTTADYMGMLATVINGLALKSGLEAVGLDARVHTAIRMDAVAEPFIRNRAVHQLDKGNVIIFVAGTGNPFFSTDTTAALRANEIGAEVILKATKVDGIYTADPRKDPNARRYETLTYAEAIEKQLGVMDLTAMTMCMERNLPICVFDYKTAGNFRKVVEGARIGTLVDK